MPETEQSMTDLDRRVAELRGWHIDEQGRVLDSNQMFQYWLIDYPYETNLAHAFALWDEARPEGWAVEVWQSSVGRDWHVAKCLNGKLNSRITVLLTDLPRAITTAWCEAMEGK
jgi:hypothetical protein